MPELAALPSPLDVVEVQVSNASKVIDGVAVLSAVSFVARPGRVTALLGPNGAGKSTLLRAIVGLDRLSSGTATVGGRALGAYERPATVLGALLTPDGVHPRRSAQGHLQVIARANGVPGEAIADVLHLTGITAIRDVPAGQLSLGMRQRLGLAAALIGDPAVLVLDEPHNGLDTAAIRWLRRTLRRLADSGRTVIFSSHLMTEVEALADDVVVIDQGRIAAEGSLQSFLADGSLEERYLGLIGELDTDPPGERR